MKKIILSAILATTFSSAYCQYFTMKLGGGYSVPGVQQSTGVLTFQPGEGTDPASSAIIPLVNYNTAVVDSSHRYKSNLYNGYGRGGHIDFSFGYMINPYFGVELDGAYLWGSTITGSQTYDDALLGSNATIITKTHSNGLSVNPSLIFRAAKPTAKVAPYARVGLALPISGAIYHTLNISSPDFLNTPGESTNATINVKTTATVSLGMQGGVGVSYTPVPLISVWGELNGQYLFVKAKQSVVTEYIINIQGQSEQNMLTSSNQLNSGRPLNTYSTTVNFVDQLTTSSNTTAFGNQRANTAATASKSGTPGYVNESAGQDELRQVANLGAFGFTIGVTINMSKKIFQDPLGKKKKD